MRDGNRTRREVLEVIGIASLPALGVGHAGASTHPTARFSFAPASPNPGEPVAFDATGSDDDDGEIVSYEWSSPDAPFDEDGETTVHTFESAGSYTVTLTVTDDSGATDSATETVTIENERPVAEFTVSPDAPSAGETVTFESASYDPDGEIAAHEWDSADSVFEASGETATHSFGSPGTYDVTLTVTDDDGAPDTRTRTVEVGNTAPSAAFAYDPSTPAPGETVTFDGSESTDPDGDVVSYEWTSPDASLETTGRRVSYSFGSPGSYDVTLTVTDDAGATDTRTRTVTVANESPAAAFQYAPTDPGVGESVTFDGSGSTDPDGDVVSYEWTSPDSAFGARGTTVTHSFDTSGAFDVTLTVTDDSGATDTRTRTVTVANAPPSADLSVAPAEPATGETVTFDGSGSTDPDGEVVSYEWVIDGAPASGVAVSRTFDAAGEYAVELTVTDDAGATDTVATSVRVTNRAPDPAVDYAPTDVTTETAVTFDGSGSADPDGEVASYEWTFPDGTTATGPTVEHTFAEAGLRTVELGVTDDGGETATETVTVDVARAPTPTASPTATRSPTASPTATQPSTSTATPTPTPTPAPGGDTPGTDSPTPTGPGTRAAPGQSGGGGSDLPGYEVLAAAAVGALGIGGAGVWLFSQRGDDDDGSPPEVGGGESPGAGSPGSAGATGSPAQPERGVAAGNGPDAGPASAPRTDQPPSPEPAPDTGADPSTAAASGAPGESPSAPGEQPPNQPSGQQPPNQPSGQQPPNQPPGQQPPNQPSGQQPPNQPPNQPSNQPPGQQPPDQPPGQQPPNQPSGQPNDQPPNQPNGQPPGSGPPAGGGAGVPGATGPDVAAVADILGEAEQELAAADALLHSDRQRAQVRYEQAIDAYQRALSVAQDRGVDEIGVTVDGYWFESVADIRSRIADANDGLDATW